MLRGAELEASNEGFSERTVRRSGPGTAPSKADSSTGDPRILAALGGIIAIAILVRAVAIGSRLHVDDAYSWWVASAPSAGVFLHRLAATENSPPLFYLILMPFAGGGPGVLRLPAAVPGVAMSVVAFLALRGRVGVRVALATALTVAVAPFLVTDSDLARGFMLADLALLFQLWALLALTERESAWRWTGFVASGAIACYSEYASAIVIVAMGLAAFWLRKPSRRHLLAAVLLVFLTVVPWVPEIVRGQDQVGVTKLGPPSAAPSLGGLRDIFTKLTFGESGGTNSLIGRWILFLALAALLTGAAVLLARREAAVKRLGDSASITLRLLGATAVFSLIGYAVAGAVGVDVFSQRYLTVLIALVAPIVLAGIAVTGWAPALAIACAGLGLLGVANAVRRAGTEYEPSLTPVRSALVAAHARTVLTNTPIVLYYLGSFRPIFDRPSNLGPGLALHCARPCATVDDNRSHGGTPRPATPTSSETIGPYVVGIER
jgi:hypothetical protein